MYGTQVQSLVQEDSTRQGAAESGSHSYWAHAVEPASCYYWAHMLLEPEFCNKRSVCNEKPVHHNQRVAPIVNN